MLRKISVIYLFHSCAGCEMRFEELENLKISPRIDTFSSAMIDHRVECGTRSRSILWVSLAAADRRSRRRWALAKINCFALTYRRNCLFCGNLLRASTRKNRKSSQQNFLVKSRKTRRREEFVVASWKFPAISWKLSDRSVGSLPIINLLALSMFSSRVEIASLECVHSISSE